MTEGKVDNCRIFPTLAPTGRRSRKRAAPIHGSSSTNVLPESPTNQAEGWNGPSFMSTSKPRLKRRKRWIGSATVKARAVGPMRAFPSSIKGPVRHQGSGDPRPASRALEDSAPAEVDAPVVARLAPGRLHRDRPHQYDRIRFFRDRHQPHIMATPKSTWQRHIRARAGWIVLRPLRLSVAERHGVWARLRHGHGRIVPDFPAAYNGIVGFKPDAAAARCPLEGWALPLSFTLDSFGPLARTAQCCAVAPTAVLANEPVRPAASRARSRACAWRLPTTGRASTNFDDEGGAGLRKGAGKRFSRSGCPDRKRIEVPEIP